MPFRRLCTDASWAWVASRAFLVALRQLHSHWLSAVAASIVASLQLSLRGVVNVQLPLMLHKCPSGIWIQSIHLRCLPAYWLNQPTNTARHLKSPKHNGWYSRCLCTLKCSQAVPGWHSLCDSFSCRALSPLCLDCIHAFRLCNSCFLGYGPSG